MVSLRKLKKERVSFLLLETMAGDGIVIDFWISRHFVANTKSILDTW